jgi:RNase P/RNase MRP subunit p29
MLEYFKDLNNLYQKEFEMEAIWLEKSLAVVEDNIISRRIRITRGHLVTVDNGRLIDVVSEPTHKIIGCHGTVTSSTLSLVVIDLKTNQPSTIKIK